MLLTGVSGASVDLRIVGYEFPEVDPGIDLVLLDPVPQRLRITPSCSPRHGAVDMARMTAELAADRRIL
jgi:hypothetical protein